MPGLFIGKMSGLGGMSTRIADKARLKGEVGQYGRSVSFGSPGSVETLMKFGSSFACNCTGGGSNGKYGWI